MKSETPTALTIAGSDSGGGAGIQADLKTFTAHKVYGMSVLTSITAQNTKKVLGIHNLSPEFIGLQLVAVATDFEVNAAKTGMLSTVPIIKSIADQIRRYKIPNLVVDPVMISKSGARLLQKEAETSLKNDIIPLAFVVTPNIPEAEVITDMKIGSIEDMKESAEKIKRMGPRNVLIKGGHLKQNKDAVDILYSGDDFYEIATKWIKTKNTHGTGCTYSAAICANLAKGIDVLEAVSMAKDYVTAAIEKSFNIGSGHGPLNHFHNIN
ncbi:MAG: bifunctional hydroxymethylpyrimidine kinase/phosphomethylpyrimidine kinase [Candidatus Dadabacteria bacterium]|nr:bifunctional hydroxymethylpyrimidine kinase/phosphomethylpyrimidine kinase [Candidatus Dadabacteria bacterium]NIS08734.1 bifunctional hydroxymethylpyrimidine kinase/phosphomethylpyrimidine kinase [Candidatus Dadabacteria bacterium]NIV42618.1 bifunctional hydroxymethylpyrimidine kinase/phosphomethylpyrimidine kinase [Candidatus Dadabacteria bacterium]NIX15420.1 bifunctional hydroxymethylpyrimidine kinase/phosphomethylpyrimidine kinase [Candidatus Dadabacteria bacterium]NIY22083.1 bifunctional